jgi:hypothetical protein
VVVDLPRVDGALVQRLLAYFRSHPRARDTAEGIARFWLDAEPREVERALEHLVKVGEVREVRVIGARHYEWHKRPQSTSIPAIRDPDGGEKESKHAKRR